MQCPCDCVGFRMLLCISGSRSYAVTITQGLQWEQPRPALCSFDIVLALLYCSLFQVTVSFLMWTLRTILPSLNSSILLIFFFYLFTLHPAHCIPPGHPIHSPSHMPHSLLLLVQVFARLDTSSPTKTRQNSPDSRTYSTYRQQLLG